MVVAVNPLNNTQQDSYLRQMRNLMGVLQHAKTDEQHKEIAQRMRQESEDYRASNPAKPLTAEEIETRRQTMMEMLKKDPFWWEMYQVRQSMSKAVTQAEREDYNLKIQRLIVKHAAEENARLTPEQRAEAQMRQTKNVRLRSELKPLLEQLHVAKSTTERKTLHAQIMEILGK